MRAGAITAAAAPFLMIVKLKCQNGRNGWNGMAAGANGRAPPASVCPVPRDAGGLGAVGGIRAWQAETYASTWPRGPVIRGPRARARRPAPYSVFGCGVTPVAVVSAQALPVSVPGLQKPGFDARWSPPRRPSGSNWLNYLTQRWVRLSHTMTDFVNIYIKP